MSPEAFKFILLSTSGAVYVLSLTFGFVNTDV